MYQNYIQNHDARLLAKETVTSSITLPATAGLATHIGFTVLNENNVIVDAPLSVTPTVFVGLAQSIAVPRLKGGDGLSVVCSLEFSFSFVGGAALQVPPGLTAWCYVLRNNAPITPNGQFNFLTDPDCIMTPISDVNYWFGTISGSCKRSVLPTNQPDNHVYFGVLLTSSDWTGITGVTGGVSLRDARDSIPVLQPNKS